RDDVLHLGAVEHRAVAAERLGRVERLVRRAQQRVGGQPVVGIRGYAQAEGERDGLVVEHVGEPAPQPLGDDEGLVLIGLGEHERELLAADRAATSMRRLLYSSSAPIDWSASSPA